MPGSSWYQSGPGNYTSTASPFGGGAGGLGGLNLGGLNFSDIMNIAISRAQDKQAQEQQMYGVKTKEELQKMKWAEEAHDPNNRHVPTPNEQMDAARIKEAQLAQADAMSGRAPMKFNEGAGIVPGYSLDPNAMTGAQRQAFLPQGSHAANIGGDPGAIGAGLPSPIDMPGGTPLNPMRGSSFYNDEPAIISAQRRKLASQAGDDGQGTYSRPIGGGYGG